MSVILLVFAIVTFVYATLGLDPQNSIHEITQGLIFVCSSIFLSAGFICITIAQPRANNETNQTLLEIKELLKIISLRFADEKKQHEEEQKRAEQEKKEQEFAQKIKSYEDLINDPVVKEEAEYRAKFYGNDAKERFLKSKAEELGLYQENT